MMMAHTKQSQSDNQLHHNQDQELNEIQEDDLGANLFKACGG